MRITSRRVSGSDEMMITVADTGIGIPRQHLPKIFEIGWSSKGVGMGFGLFWTRDYIQGLGGYIDVASEVGEGTTFTVKLPLADEPERRARMSDQPLRVHLLRTPDPGPLDYLRELIDDDVVVTTGEELPDPPDYHIFIAGRPQREHIAEAPQLQTLIIPWAGLPRDTRALMLDFPEVAVHNLHHNAAPVAELAVGLLLAAAKFLIPMDRALRAHDWTPRYQPNPSLLLAEKTALVLGYGEIGQRVAEICRGMRMKVVATRRNVEEIPPDCP